MRLVVCGQPVPLQRSRTRGGRHYLPRRSRAYRELVQACWMAAGRPSIGDAAFALSACFYGANPAADLDNLVKAVCDALNGLA
jgi:Holliday junction resolvase RusA-like endonuclease